MNFSARHPWRAAVLAVALCAGLTSGQDFEREPIEYSKTPAADRIARLIERIARTEVQLARDPKHGYLPAILEELDVPASSQVFVFSKTSFQRELIAPETPRALYFNDDVYVGFCQNGEVVELAAQDPRQGTIFYTLDQRPADKATPVRRNAECLQCHSSPLTKGVPGVLVRSVYPDPLGLPVLKAGTFVTDHSSPLRERWGGWYVTGNHGPDLHMGNALLPHGDADPDSLRSPMGANLTRLGDRFATDPYLAPHSDIVALMVLEHQTQLHNLLTSASYQARVALYQQEAMSGLTGEPTDRPSESTLRRFDYAATPLLKYLLFVDEARLGAPIRGTSAFAAEFPQRGRRDKQGRSLRDLDLTRRLFKHPCSYLIYSDAFDGLPLAFKEHLYGRLLAVLTSKEASKDFAGLVADDRRAILEILAETKSDLPEAWRQAVAERPAGERRARM